MKINSLYIHAFGGLKDLRLDLGDGLTVIYGDNEMGKTTVMAFIKMMFYGSGRASAQLSKNIRQKYTPWDGAQMAGSIDFEHGGKRYRLEKEFRSSNSTDKATLCDLDIGTRQAVASDVGNTFFGISLSAFERSVFIGQLGYPEKDTAAEGEINSKLSNMALTGEESVSYEAVNGRLQKAKLTLMSKSGKAGEYDKSLKLMGEIKDRIDRSEALNRVVGEKKTQITALENEIEYFGKKALSLKEKINTEQDVRNAEKLAKLLELKNQLDSLNETLKLDGGALVDEMFLRKLQFCISKVQAAEDKITAKQNEAALLQKSIDAGLNPPSDATKENAAKAEENIATLTAEKQSLEGRISEAESNLDELEKQLPTAQRAKKKINLPLTLIGAGVILIALLLIFVVSSTISATGVGIGVILTVLGLVLRPNDPVPYQKLNEKITSAKNDIANLKLKISTVTSELSSNEAKLEAINTALNSSAAVIEKQQELLAECKKELSVFSAEKQCEEEKLFSEFSKYRTSQSFEEIISSLDEIATKTAKQKELKQQLGFILNDLNGISYEDAAKKLEALKYSNIELTQDFGQLKTEYEQLLTHITDRKSQIAALTAEIRSAVSGAEEPEQLKKQLAELKEKTDSQKEFCLCLDIASAVLTESFGELRRSYGSVLEQKAGSIFEGLTDNKYSSMSISKSLDINVEKAGVFGSREIDYLSSGTADQAYLSMRLALAELMCQDGEALPLLLDDALTQYDDGRMKTALEFLKLYAQNTQVIMFTCHKSIAEVSKQIGANCKNLVE